MGNQQLGGPGGGAGGKKIKKPRQC